MSGREARADLPRDLDRTVLRKASDALQQRSEIFTVDVLHREKRVAVGFIDVVDAAHVGMRDLARHAHFGVQLREPGGIAVDIRGEKLEGDRLSELQIIGAINLAHAALAEPAKHSIPSAENGAGLEASVIDRAGACQPARRGRDGGGAGRGDRARCGRAVCIGGDRRQRRQTRLVNTAPDLSRQGLAIRTRDSHPALRTHAPRFFREHDRAAVRTGQDFRHRPPNYIAPRRVRFSRPQSWRPALAGPVATLESRGFGLTLCYTSPEDRSD